MEKTTSQKNLRIILIGSLIILNLLFLVYWIALSLNYSLHYDDVHFMWKMREYSIFEYVKEMYFTRGGNFVGYGINGIIFSISNWLGEYRFWPILTYCIGLCILMLSIKGLFNENNKFTITLGSIAIYNVYILTVPDFAVFTWLCAMGYYLYAPAICLLIRYLNENYLKWWQNLILCLLALYLAGCNIGIAPVALLVMFANGMLLWHGNDWNIKQTWQDKRVKRIVFTAIGMLLILAIFVAAPGNYSRLETESDINTPTNICQFFIALLKCTATYIYMMSFYFVYHLLSFSLGLCAGAVSNNHFVKNRRKALLLAVGIFVIYMIISIMPLAYLSGGFEIQRNYTHITFFYVLLFFVVGYIITEGRTKYANWSYLSGIIMSLFMTVIVCLNIYQDVPVAINYNKAHKERFAYLENLQRNGNNETVIVEPYPSVITSDVKSNVFKLLGKESSGQAVMYPSDTDVFPNEYESHIRHLYHLDFDFVLPSASNQ